MELQEVPRRKGTTGVTELWMATTASGRDIPYPTVVALLAGCALLGIRNNSWDFPSL